MGRDPRAFACLALLLLAQHFWRVVFVSAVSMAVANYSVLSSSATSMSYRDSRTTCSLSQRDRVVLGVFISEVGAAFFLLRLILFWLFSTMKPSYEARSLLFSLLTCYPR